MLTWYAARRNKDTGDHYVAGRRIGGFGNGLALAGDQISAASFLGITGAIALTGFNGWWLIVGMPIAYVLVLLLVAEPLRNLGKYTLADVIATRFESRGLRASIALATVIMTVIYMTVQFIGAGLIAGALLDVDFTVAVLILGGLMTLYTVLGGMVAATYIQIFKTSLLAVMVLAVFVAVIKRTGWNPIGPMLDATDSFGDKVVDARPLGHDRLDQQPVAHDRPDAGDHGPPPRDAALPHRARRAGRAQLRGRRDLDLHGLLPDAADLRLRRAQRDRQEGDRGRQPGRQQRRADAGAEGRRRRPLRAGRGRDHRDDPRRAGRAWRSRSPAPSAHDLYTNVLKKGHVDERGQLISGRLAGAVSAAVAILLALGAKDLNIANVANIAFAIAASTTMPTLLLTIYWRRFNQVGALSAMIGGLIVSLVLVLLGPDVMGKDDAIWPLAIPAIVSVPASFLFAYLGTLIGAGRVGSTGMPYDEFERPRVRAGRGRSERPLHPQGS